MCSNWVQELLVEVRDGLQRLFHGPPVGFHLPEAREAFREAQDVGAIELHVLEKQRPRRFKAFLAIFHRFLCMFHRFRPRFGALFG